MNLFGSRGVRLEDITAKDNGNTGIRIGNGTLDNCTVRNNGVYGVEASIATVTNCVAVDNPVGISVDLGTLRSCVVFDSQSTGIIAVNAVVESCDVSVNPIGINARESIIRNNVVSGSYQDGIRLTDGTGRNTVSDNLVRGSGTQAGAPGAHGIFVTTNGNRISQNHVVATNGRGIRVEGSYNMIDDNNASENSVSQVAPGGMGFYIQGTGNTVIRNSAAFNLTSGVTQNYSFGGGNNVAPVQPPASATNPMANTE